MTYDYVARVTFEAESDQDARQVKAGLNTAILQGAINLGRSTELQSNLYNTSAPDMPGGVEVTPESLPGFDRSNPGFDNSNGLGG